MILKKTTLTGSDLGTARIRLDVEYMFLPLYDRSEAGALYHRTCAVAVMQECVILFH